MGIAYTFHKLASLTIDREAKNNKSIHGQTMSIDKSRKSARVDRRAVGVHICELTQVYDKVSIILSRLDCSYEQHEQQ